MVIKARVVRHQGTRFRSAPLPKHIAYLKREGVTRDGENARMFDAATETADERAFAERCEDDRHHFRFIVSPEDATQIGTCKTFTRELMTDVENDLGTKLDWIAVDHWNTDNPHIHVLVRGRADDGKDLVSSAVITSAMASGDRAAERVTLGAWPTQRAGDPLRPGEGSRGGALDQSRSRALRDISDEGGGVVDLRPGSGKARPRPAAASARPCGEARNGWGSPMPLDPGCWSLKPGLEPTLRELGIRGDIIKTMHKAMSRRRREPDVSGFVLHGEEPSDPVLGRLVERGLDDELKGTAYAIVAGVDGRTHHLRFSGSRLDGRRSCRRDRRGASL